MLLEVEGDTAEHTISYIQCMMTYTCSNMLIY